MGVGGGQVRKRKERAYVNGTRRRGTEVESAITDGAGWGECGGGGDKAGRSPISPVGQVPTRADLGLAL